MPHKIPRPRGRSVVTSAFVDASHIENKVTRRSHSGYVLFINRGPVQWIIKTQKNIRNECILNGVYSLETVY